MGCIKRTFICFCLIGLWMNTVGASSSFPGQSALALFNLRAASIDVMGYNSEIIYNLISALTREGTITVMPRREMQEMLFKHGITQSDNESQVSKAGKVLGVSYVFFGSIEKKDSDTVIHCILKLMDLRTGEVVLNDGVDILGKNAIRDQMTELARKIGSVIKEHDESVVEAGKPAAVPESAVAVSEIVSTVSAKPSRKGILVTWGLTPSAETIVGYHVYRSENSTGPFQFIGKATKPEFNDETVTEDKEYFYRIGALLASGKEIRTEKPASATKTSLAMPYPPLIMGKKGYAQRVAFEFIPSLLNQQEHFMIKHYKVFRKEKGGEWKLLETINKKSANMGYNYPVEDQSDLKENTSYFYAVSSVDEKMVESELSPPVEITTMASPELTLVKENMLRRIDLAWQPVEEAEAYILYRKTDGEDWQKISRIAGNKPCSYQDTKNNLDDTVYFYQLTAFDGKGETAPSRAVQGKTKAPIDYPENFKARSGLVKRVELTWEPVQDTDVGGYTIYRQIEGDTFQKIATLTGAQKKRYQDKSSVIHAIKDGTTYIYTITTFNLFKVEGKFSEKVSATTKPVPKKVGEISVKGRKDAIVLQWQRNPEPDIQHYTILRKKGSMGWTTIKEVSAATLEYVDSDVKPNVEYQYSIFATDKDKLKGSPGESDKVMGPIIMDN